MGLLWHAVVTANRRPSYSFAARQSAWTAPIGLLQRELKDATARAHEATDAFNAIMGDIPSSVPQPDGTQRINNVYRDLSLARREMMRAHSRLTHFIDHGTIPEDLD